MEHQTNPPEYLWTFAILLAFGLVILTLVLIVNPPGSNPDLKLELIGSQQLIVVHEGPTLASGVAGLLNRGTLVQVRRYDPTTHQSWVQITGEGITGWVPLDNLAEAEQLDSQ
jgi:uncharacterized protein YgiM (DUF1202 family)